MSADRQARRATARPPAARRSPAAARRAPGRRRKAAGARRDRPRRKRDDRSRPRRARAVLRQALRLRWRPPRQAAGSQFAVRQARRAQAAARAERQRTHLDACACRVMPRTANASTNGSGMPAWCARAATPRHWRRPAMCGSTASVSPRPASRCAIGDVVTLALDRSVRVVQVEGFCDEARAQPAAPARFTSI